MRWFRRHPLFVGIVLTFGLLTAILLAGLDLLTTAPAERTGPGITEFGTYAPGESLVGSVYLYNFTIQFSGPSVTVSNLSFQIRNISYYGDVAGCYGQYCGQNSPLVPLGGDRVLLFAPSGCPVARYDVSGDPPDLFLTTSCPTASPQSHVAVGDILTLEGPTDLAAREYALSTPWGYTSIR